MRTRAASITLYTNFTVAVLAGLGGFADRVNHGFHVPVLHDGIDADIGNQRRFQPRAGKNVLFQNILYQKAHVYPYCGGSQIVQPL